MRDTLPLNRIDVVTVAEPGTGCAASLRAALDRVDARADGIVLMLGDQPGVQPATLRRMIDEGPGADIAVCRYDDGIGHPLWLGRSVFGELRELHGDKAVWKIVESGRHLVRELAVGGSIPPDVDTWDDYHRLVTS